jgi:hypothetical protein
MPASTKNKLYEQNINAWELVRDCTAGSAAVKQARYSQTTDNNNNQTGLYNAIGSKYLPVPNPSDNSQENQDRYYSYKQRANFVNFTGSTKEGFLGMVNRKQPTIELDPSIAYMEDNSNGAGLELEQMIQFVTSEALEVARHGLLADYPISARGLNKANTANLRASIKQYPAESILNWRESVINGETVLSMVALAEDVEKVSADGFDSECLVYTRVLKLDEGVYKQCIYDEEDKLLSYEDESGEMVSDLIPRKSDGSTWDFIPFKIIGAVNNDPAPDKSPLYDIAEINIAHYRNSADFEESSFMLGQPTPVISGLTQGWVTDVMKGGVMFGSRTAILLPEGASATLLQANQNQMPERGMELKEKQLIAVGARIITDSSGVETAEAAKIRFAGQNSKLALVVNNVEAGILNVLEWCTMYMGGTGESIVDINRQFYEASVNPQLIIAEIQLMDRNVITKTDVRERLRKTGVISHERTDEDIDAEAGEVNPLL